MTGSLYSILQGSGLTKKYLGEMYGPGTVFLYTGKKGGKLEVTSCMTTALQGSEEFTVEGETKKTPVYQVNMMMAPENGHSGKEKMHFGVREVDLSLLDKLE